MDDLTVKDLKVVLGQVIAAFEQKEKGFIQKIMMIML